MGGRQNVGGNAMYGSVWKSTANIVSWTLQTALALWGAKGRFGMIAVNIPQKTGGLVNLSTINNILLMGGSDGVSFFNGVYKSVDLGATWTKGKSCLKFVNMKLEL